MIIKNSKHKLMQVVGIAAAIAILWLSLVSVAEAHAAQKTAALIGLHPAGPVVPSFNGPVTGCVFQTYNGHYLTAVGGGGRITDVIHTDAARFSSWEKFTLIDSRDGTSVIRYGIQTFHGFYLTAVGGGGRITDVIHSDATQLQAWEKFSLISLGYGVYAIETINGHYLTAVDGGGRITDTIHSDATQIRAWEKFQVSCGH
ncbi:hypothetical protein KSF_001940 [Reticulibacter mediterranei]|uniref:Uncharacterized protein n=1 Tax=Reticulibacter mediterranei TaxID=2778369 RepID=A0A8J3I918_9CHLR|nr:hypothetical protein [Reticulibacter mediterranei]GHO90146.1 hypothetical protein KSF_001940 [Reticulibacter mediterranei]